MMVCDGGGGDDGSERADGMPPGRVAGEASCAPRAPFTFKQFCFYNSHLFVF